ncbi:MAG: type III-B CRISPR module RAMP protein Cmr1, partial [Thermodesulfobacteriota bacterium]|nr:type III-B CRISPR module RAMP protein Cmr1 [Thermodesulfobacteriota bacterium]
MMNRIQFELETITPLFMAGANGQTSELRPSSFKGMMRFWWRAMRAEDDIQKKLLEDEAKIFGGTGKGQGKSKIMIRIEQKNFKEGKDIKKYADVQSHPGVGYLLYSTLMQKREYFEHSSKLRIEISSPEIGSLHQAEAAFWLSVNFGGFGTRSRRGGGNFAVNDCHGLDDEHTKCLKKRYIPKDNIQAFLTEGYKEAKKTIIQNKTSKYSNLSGASIFIGQGYENWQKALDSVGVSLMTYRAKKKPDYDIFTDYLTGSTNNNEFERVKFGLPLGGRFNNNPVVKGRSFNITPKVGNDSTRRASPLILKIIRN